MRPQQGVTSKGGLRPPHSPHWARTSRSGLLLLLVTLPPPRPSVPKTWRYGTRCASASSLSCAHSALCLAQSARWHVLEQSADGGQAGRRQVTGGDAGGSGGGARAAAVAAGGRRWGAGAHETTWHAEQ